MPCTGDGTLAICRPTTVTLRAVRICPCCKERRRQVGEVAVWYDTRWTCCGCGDSYSLEGLEPRPFARGWRVDAIRRARRRWAEAPPLDEANLMIHEMVMEYVDA